MRTKTHCKTKRTKKNKTQKGGKTISSSKPVKLSYENKMVVCSVCGNNNYIENTGSFGKSKVREGLGQAIFGEAAEILDSTSVIIYTCNNCGLCKIIRNRDPIKIIAKPV